MSKLPSPASSTSQFESPAFFPFCPLTSLSFFLQLHLNFYLFYCPFLLSCSNYSISFPSIIPLRMIPGRVNVWSLSIFLLTRHKTLYSSFCSQPPDIEPYLLSHFTHLVCRSLFLLFSLVHTPFTLLNLLTCCIPLLPVSPICTSPLQFLSYLSPITLLIPMAPPILDQ